LSYYHNFLSLLPLSRPERGLFYGGILKQDIFICLRYNKGTLSHGGREMTKTTRLACILLILGVGLSACNLPSNLTPTAGAEALLTAAAQTTSANQTQGAILNPPTIPPTNTLGFATATQRIATTSAPPTSAPPTQSCDLAQFIKDVTIPDGTEFKPNETFTKTWQLKNIGTCTWSGYTLVFDAGESMGGPASVPIGTVGSGQEVNVSVDLKSPGSDGTYTGYWRIKNASGVLLPVAGGYQNKSFFVEIKVKTPTPTPTVTATATATLTVTPTATNTP
jgi:hypothetical protein